MLTATISPSEQEERGKDREHYKNRGGEDGGGFCETCLKHYQDMDKVCCSFRLPPRPPRCLNCRNVFLICLAEPVGSCKLGMLHI